MAEQHHNIDEIISSLEAQFTGEEEHDLKIMHDYSNSLERSDDNVDIIMAIGKYCLEHFPNAESVQRAKAMQEKFDEFQSQLQTAQKHLADKQFAEAIEIFDKLIGENKPVESADKRYLSFNHPFEEMLCRAFIQDERPIERISTLPIALYYQKAAALFELGRYDESKACFEECLKLDPVDVRVLFELAQIAKAQKDTNALTAVLKRVYPFIFTRHFIARLYREYANLATMREDYSLAVALVYISIDYEDTQPARAMLNALAKHRGIDLSKPNAKRIKEMLGKAEIPVGPFPQVYQLAIDMGRHMKRTYPEIAKMAFGIAYELTHYQPILKELQQLQ